MQTSRFQLGLIAALAAALGFSVNASQAIGSPPGPAVSYGSNPVVAVAGQATDTPTTVFTAPPDQRLIVTDVVLTFGDDGAGEGCTALVELTTSGGATVGTFQVSADIDGANMYTPSSIQMPFRSGLPIPAGESLLLSSETAGVSCNAQSSYTLSGYYAHP